MADIFGSQSQDTSFRLRSSFQTELSVPNMAGMKNENQPKIQVYCCLEGRRKVLEPFNHLINI
jgi:hypothetical protein